MSIEALTFAKKMDLGKCEGAQARLLVYVIAENTFNDSFLCRLCQEQLAYEARASESTIRRHLRALEEARIILRRRARDEDGRLGNHVIRLVGYKRWYNTQHADSQRKFRARHRPPVNLTGGEKPNEKPPVNLTGGEPATGHVLTGGPPVTVDRSAKEESRTSEVTVQVKTPPTPSAPAAPAVAAVDGLGEKPEFDLEGLGTVGEQPTPAITVPAPIALPTPSLPTTAAASGLVPWLADLAAEGQPRLVIDHLLAPLAAGGLSGWKGQDGAKIDPRGPARQLCVDLAGLDAETLDELRKDIRREFKYRFPPLPVFLERAKAASEAVAQRRRDAERLAALPPVPVLADATARFLAVVEKLSPAVRRAWFSEAGVVSVARDVVTVATRHRPVTVEQFGDSFAVAAARSLWGQSIAVRFVQGRPVQGAAA